MPNQPLGRLKLWHARRYQVYQDVPFEDRTLGSLMREFYLSLTVMADGLRSRRSELTGEELEQLADLEEILDPEDRTVITDMDDDEVDKVVAKRVKGDPLATYWEYRYRRNLPVDLEMGEDDIPPRDRWDD